jgi:pimeloyl-ACP methyl ester carboxylesterase
VQRLADAAAALALLRKHAPRLALFLIGHSEGALVAAKLAESEDVAGVLSLAAPYGNLFELYKARAQRRHTLAPTDKTARAIEFAAKLEAHFKEGGRMLPDEFAAFASPYLGAGYEGWESYDWLAGHWAEALQADPRGPMLVVQGGRDARVWPDNAQRWQKWCAARAGTEFALIDHMGHDLNDARHKAFRVDEDVLRTVCDWVTRVTSRQAPSSTV